mgnify:CR=1 FL=1
MPASPDFKTLEAAASWYVQLNDGTSNEARAMAWQTWLHASPANAAAWPVRHRKMRSVSVSGWEKP